MTAPWLDVRIDPRSGFCPGVGKAIRLAEEALDAGQELFCLGDVVHNEEEVARLAARGLKVVDREGYRRLRNKTVLFRAHGEPPESYETARLNGLRILDATCPVVRQLQQRVQRAAENGETVLICGKPGHPEVEGLLGRAGGCALVAEDPDGLLPETLPDGLSVFCQTTLPVENLQRMTAFLQGAGVRLKVHDTICACVSGRVPRLKAFAAGHDVVVFVGGRQSSNARALFKSCLEANPDSHFVTGPGNLSAGWFSQGQKVGVSGSASTPLWLLRKVAAALETLPDRPAVRARKTAGRNTK
jgi:4-hydroxy-3-methylbut-2-enyl diphosphate reductase